MTKRRFIIDGVLIAVLMSLVAIMVLKANAHLEARQNMLIGIGCEGTPTQIHAEEDQFTRCAAIESLN